VEIIRRHLSGEYQKIFQYCGTLLIKYSTSHLKCPYGIIKLDNTQFTQNEAGCALRTTSTQSSESCTNYNFLVVEFESEARRSESLFGNVTKKDL